MNNGGGLDENSSRKAIEGGSDGMHSVGRLRRKECDESSMDVLRHEMAQARQKRRTEESGS